MIIKVLVENTAISEEYGKIHGLCLYIETEKHKILFDLGPDKLFLENAEKMGVKIEEIDTVVISHGHYDHGGALGLFLRHNHRARIYVHKKAFTGHFTKVMGLLYIGVGLDASLASHEQIVLTEGNLELDEELLIITDVKERELFPQSNRSLYTAENGKKLRDDFAHEQSLLIREGENKVLLAGCAHCGIVNIVNRANRDLGEPVTHVIGGFHIWKDKSPELVRDIAQRLKGHDIRYYTCHCTGQKNFALLQEEMKEQIQYVPVGTVLKI